MLSYTFALSGIPCAAFILDDEGFVIAVNTHAEAMGVRVGEEPRFDSDHDELLALIARRESGVAREVSSHRTRAVRIGPWMSEGGSRARMVLIVDVADDYAREQASQVAVFRHELGNMAAALSGALMVLDHGPAVAADRDESLRRARGLGDRLNSLVRALHQFPPPRPSARLVSAAILAGAAALRVQERRPVVCSGDAKHRIHADPDQILSALTTIVEDVAHSVPASAAISIEVRRTGRSIAIVIETDVPLWLADEGDPFRPFFRRDAKYAGLAYAIARALVVSNGGAVSGQIRGERTEIAMVFPSREDQ